MSSVDPSRLLRSGLLHGSSLLVLYGEPAAPAPPTLAQAIADACTQLGASAQARAAPAAAGAGAGAGEEIELDRLATAHELRALDVLAIDAGSLFAAAAAAAAAAEHGARAALSACMQLTWELTRAVADAAFLQTGRPGRIVYLAPCAQGVQIEMALYARAARAALENLARTLSIEFSRHAVTTVAIAPGERTSAQELAALVAYLASPAGAYFSGCLLDMTGAAPASRASERAR